MPMGYLSRHAGVLSPAELSLLQDVFDVACAEGCAAPKSPEAEEIARDILIAYQNGAADREALLAILLRIQKRNSA